MNTAILSTKDSENKTIEELYESLESSSTGLSSEEYEKRFEEYGPNELIERRVNPLIKFLRYFWGPIPFMIEAAMILSAIVQHWPDFWIISLMLGMNGIVGFYQENKADSAIEKLKERLSPTARVLRDGNWKQLPAREVVPGDIVRIRPGDIIPADIKLVSGEYLSVDQSALTGESLPVDKSTGDISFQGSPVKVGEMEGLVVNTGMNTYYGKTAKLVEEAVTKSHFEKIIRKIGNYLIELAVTMAVIVFAAGIIRGDNLLENIRFVLVLTVAAIPVALPAVLSVTMAVGAVALAKKGAIVSKLAAIEEMAGVDILCTDKTGTITKNELSIGSIKPYGEFTENDVLRFGLLSSRKGNKDAIDDAIIYRAEAVPDLEPVTNLKLLEFKPFDPVSKRTEATFKSSDSSQFKVSKGAPQVIAGLTNESDSINDQINKDVLIFAEKGYRALGVAKTSSDNSWHFVGLLALFDPPRDDSAGTIASAQKMGINVKMITGDHIAIAKEIASRVGLGQNMALPKDFTDVPDEQAEPIVESVDGFAQVFPEHKYRIVSLLQDKNHIVGMTGDGVNDAPALKKADVGIAVEGSTDVAKSAADIVLTGVGISVIVDAIRNSRKIFQRMSNYSIYRIAESIRVILFITASILVFQFYPVTAIMIVLLALLNDLPIMTIAYDNVKYSKAPERWNAKMLLGMATFLGIIGVIASFGIFVIGNLVFHLSQEVLQSFIYLKLSVAGHLTLLVARTRGPFWSVKPALPLISAILGTQFIATLITVYGFLLPAMGWGLALFVWGYALVWFLITDVLKTLFYKHGGLELIEEL
jgi:H+-transporting ATPase